MLRGKKTGKNVFSVIKVFFYREMFTFTSAIASSCARSPHCPASKKRYPRIQNTDAVQASLFLEEDGCRSEGETPLSALRASAFFFETKNHVVCIKRV